MTSWSAYHASYQALPPTKSDVYLTSMLPLFCNAANSVTMICHAMNVVKNAVQILIRVRYQSSHVQPLYALAKKIQLSWHQVTASSLYLLLQMAYNECVC